MSCIHVELRLRNLEEVTHQIDSTLASQSAEPILNENFIEEIVARKIEERLKDLKTQHKNSISVLSKQVDDLQLQIENQVSGLKKEIDMIKTRTANTNDRCGRLEKAVKFTERQLLEKINMMKDELSSELKNDLGLDSNKENDNISVTSNEIDTPVTSNETSNETATYVSVPSAMNSFSYSVHAAKRTSSEVNLERRSEKSTHLQSPEHSSASNMSTANSVNKFQNSAFNVGSRPTEVVVLMDSNRKYLDFESVFPEIKMRIIPCGNTDKANTVINYPRFKEVEAIMIHTGTNDLENDNMDTRMIANRLIEISNNALEKFPTAKIILSEILPRNDEFNMKGTEVNSILAGASVSAKFHLVKHSNLAKQSFFFDRKHLNKFRGVAVMRRNISNVFSSLFPGIKINENSLQQSGYSTRTLFPPRERYDNPSNTSRSIVHPSGVPMSTMVPPSGVLSPMVPRSGVPNMSPMVNDYNQKATGSYIVPDHSYARAVAHGSNGLNKQPPYAYDKDLMSEMIKQLTLMNNSINALMGFHT